MIVQQTSMRYKGAIVFSLPLSALANFTGDGWLQCRAINSYTTTGHTLPQSHLPTKQDAYITTHQ